MTTPFPSCFLISNWFLEYEHPFIDKAMVTTEPLKRQISRDFKVFLTEVIINFALSTTIRSRNEPMAKPLTSWLVPSFLQHNLRLVVSGHCLHISVTKFQDKFAILRK